MKPMTSAPVNLSILTYPKLVSIKLDGIRCIIKSGVAYSRRLKALPNRRLQEWATHNARALEGLDGELIIGPPNDPLVYNRTSSGIMSHDGDPRFMFYVFDYIHTPNVPYKARFDKIDIDEVPNATKLAQIFVTNEAMLKRFEAKAVDEGYEGIMIRSPTAPYKFGRSTSVEQGLLKLKQFVDDEAVVIDCIEEMQNNNPATINELGRTKRSSHQENKIPKGTLGALVCRTPDGQVFNVGGGFTAHERLTLWRERHELIGKTITYKYFPVGVKDAPRHPIFKAFRPADA
jgi:DNA ligase-1